MNARDVVAASSVATIATLAFAASVAAVACGHARAPDVVADAAASSSASPDATGTDGAAASDATARRALPSEQDFLVRAAAAAPGFRLVRSFERSAPFRLDVDRPDGGSTCLRIVVAADAPLDVHLEDSLGPRGTIVHDVDAVLPSDGPLCLSSADGVHAILEARGAAEARVAVLAPR